MQNEQPRPINDYSTEELRRFKSIFEKWIGLPFSYKQIIDELDDRDKKEVNKIKPNFDVITT